MSPCVIHRSSFLLHRPHVRLDELPLFDALFTGVQQGAGARGGGGGGMGGGDASVLSSALSDPGAATTKARAWMLRALRDGEGRCFEKWHIYPIEGCVRAPTTVLFLRDA